MTQYIVKIVLSALLIVLIAEVSKRSTMMGAVLASIPIISVMAITWLYIDTHNLTTISRLSWDVFWLVIPSLILFVTLPIFIKLKVPFYGAMGLAILATASGYGVMIVILSRLGVR